MTHPILFSTLLATGLTAACASADSASGQKQAGTAPAHGDSAKAEVKDAGHAWGDYAYAQKDKFVDEMKKEMATIHQDMDRLSAKVDKSTGTAKVDAKAKLDAVREKWAHAKKHLDRAEAATESDWGIVKGDFEKSYSEMKDSFDNTRQWLSDKIAP
jgi:peptidoglycan hydrolase CwlO-like protein